ncbi:MAG: ATP-dependent DNA helicase RecG [Acidimicrobiales bacterium]
MNGAAGGRTLRFLGDKGVSELRSVKARKAAGLASMGIESVLDLLMHYPRRYIDRRHQSDIGALAEDEEAMVTATVQRVSARRTSRGKTMVQVAVEDSTARLMLVFFNQPWRARQLAVGSEVVVFGRTEIYRGARQMTNPVVDLVGDQTGRLVPVYPQSGKAKIGSTEIAGYVAEALERTGRFAEVLPAQVLDELGLLGRTEAFRGIHAPESFEERDVARRRLAFDELLRLQLILVMQKRAAATQAPGIPHLVTPPPGRASLVGEFLGHLPFRLTTAQERAIREVSADLAASHPMHRLLQGDVGAGKTVVALATLLYGVQGGHQGALMVPTEVLAEQHYLAASSFLAGLEVPDATRIGGARPLEVALLTNRTTGSERARIQAELATGSLDLVVGTHALLTDNIRFHSLGVVVIDEQHRFGVEQRAALREKGPATLPDGSFGDGEGPSATSETEQGSRHPDVLVMTATPIPRTAAMTVYGDLDQTVLDELPVGRTPVTTAWLNGPDECATAWQRVRKEITAGHQAYVICPLVGGGQPEDEEPESLQEGPEIEDYEPEPYGDAGRVLVPTLPIAGLGLGPEETPRQPPKSVVEEYARLSAGELAGFAVGLLHGQLPSKEKEATMAAFRRGELQVLVATTVIEVGVDVANATVMVIEDADRFGIAQLHQLRGRVGRGRDKSWCYLLAEGVTGGAAKRLGALEDSSDGFELAEVDLELRGEGTVFGIRQKGRSDLRLASLRRDKPLVRAARQVAEAIIDEDPTLAAHPLLADEVHLFVAEESEEFVLKG